ncbi:UDP-glycosyltransferase 92A1-like [Neltuma alba]|uniref:UDP-glycosyltransferase 92A1-like n=1 Tax=Neltuma alba TaxID=207710 RepID=UPI0010A3D27B|nr:UDP-glycosyltransferase 92A1-like [Prosopis alba]XP_028808517.1 UDP-glycosyltransferase 92A1-like [Prosopis alba]
MEAPGKQDMDIVLFPFMAQGHIIPFLALALQLERSTNNTITVVNTPFNIQKLRASLPPHSSLNLLEIPFHASDHGLPPNTENTDAVPYSLVIRLLEASTSLRPAFKLLLQNLLDSQHHRRPLCVIADIFFGWTAGVAKEVGAFHVIFSASGGHGMACYYSLWFHLPRRNGQCDEFSLPDFPEAGHIHKTQLPTNISEADGSDAWSLFQRKNLSGWADSDGILFNTLEEIDSGGLHYFTRKLGLPVWAIGPVVLSTGSGSRGKGGGVRPELCREWLDTKPCNSVLYVCFGSMNTVSAAQMMELGMALERSGRNFIWVVRPPIGYDINSEFRAEEWLPQGFVGRIRESGRGLIAIGWAPQLEILSHKAVSAFLSHCGWNSVLEALSHGVPILGWPMAAEQFFNCKFLEEQVGVCTEVARGKSCEVRHQDIAAKIDAVMADQGKGTHMRTQAHRLRDIIANAFRDEDAFTGSSIRAMRDFLHAAATLNDR